jgi:hypothetical protein
MDPSMDVLGIESCAYCVRASYVYRSMHESCTYIVACVPLTLYRKLFFDLFAHLFGLVIGGDGRSSISFLFLSERCLS